MTSHAGVSAGIAAARSRCDSGRRATAQHLHAAQGGRHLSCRRPAELQPAAVGGWLEEGGVLQEVQHGCIPDAGQQTLPGMMPQEVGCRIGVEGIHSA